MKLLVPLFCILLSPTVLSAATVISYTATADPNLSPDSVDNFGNPADAWVCTLPGSGTFDTGSYFAGGVSWATYSVSQKASAFHFFEGGDLAVDQGVSLVFANAGMATGHSVGINISSGVTPLFSLYFTGGGPGTYSYMDAAGSGQDTGEPFSFYGSNTLTFTLTSATTYAASFGTHAWTGTLTGDPVTAIEVFNDADQGADNSVFFNSLAVYAVPEPSIAALALIGVVVGTFSLRRKRNRS
ncbi:MAG: PEP-CTERM sorting domain-containing protein [Chthoniobacterales bacterium]